LSQPQPNPTTRSEEPTLGFLLCSAIATENSREHNRRVLERVAAKSSIRAYGLGAQIAALEVSDPWAGVPAALRLRAYANREFGTDLTPEAVRRIRGRVCEALEVDTAAADALPLSRVVEVLAESEGQPTTEGGDTMTAFRWLRVRQIAGLFGFNPGHVAKTADAGIFVTNGKSGPERRIDVLSVIKKQLAQLNGTDPDDAPA
jgi:hypothetical protein